MCFAWISEQTAIYSLYSIKLSGFITEAESLLRGTNCVFNSDSYSFVLKRLMYLTVGSWQEHSLHLPGTELLRLAETTTLGSYSSCVPVKGLIIRDDDGHTGRAALTKTEDGNTEDYF